MGKINVLSFAVANLIAAGEVVDRPASVIKELMENAIDAGADSITVEIQHGGITLMRVADNGCGMSKEDLPVAIKRHATSKIREAADLDGITTLGFRGEALAAIAAVSDLRIITRTADAPFGSLLTAKAGEVLDIAEQGCPVGTTVIVENLFANVPARRKFLKKDVSEAIAVGTYVEKIALSRPDIAIRLIVDGTMRLDTAGDGDLKSAMYAVFGRDFVGRTIAVSGGAENVRVEGFIGRSDNVRPKRNYENFFINGRFVNSRTAAAALEQAFTSFIPPEKFPCCVLNLTINPAAVDVNVHPAKLEVKFSDERPVFEAVFSAVRTALEANTTRPEIVVRPPPTADRAFVPVEEGRRASLARDQLTMPTAPAEKRPAFEHISAADYAEKYVPRAAAPNPYLEKQRQTAPEKHAPVPVAEKKEPTPQPAPAVTAEEAPAWCLVGEVFLTYLLVERGDTLLLIDKHAAHERVLFEELNARRKARGREATQILLLPLDVPLSGEDRETLEANREEVEAVGFAFRLSAHAASVSEIPEGLEPAAAGELLASLAVTLREGTGTAAHADDLHFEKALYQSACKAAIKGGREYPPGYNEELCKKLMALPDVTVCPHGRPVAMELTRAALDRQFKRT